MYYLSPAMSNCFDNFLYIAHSLQSLTSLLQPTTRSSAHWKKWKSCRKYSKNSMTQINTHMLEGLKVKSTTHADIRNNRIICLIAKRESFPTRLVRVSRLQTTLMYDANFTESWPQLTVGPVWFGYGRWFTLLCIF